MWVRFIATLCYLLTGFTSSFLKHSIGDLSSSYSEMTALHNRRNYNILPTVGDVNYTSYKGYNIENITSLLSKQAWKQSFDVNGNFHPLISKLNQKLVWAKNNRSKNITLNVMYIGGSVCAGHGCFPVLSTEQMKNGVSADDLLHASFHCSWPHRFTHFLQFILSKYVDHLPHNEQDVEDEYSGAGQSSGVLISPRYCCRPATSSTTGVDILLTRAYANECSSNDRNGMDGEYDNSWEPDLVIWDYSVNDMHSQWFKTRKRKVVYEGFVKTVLAMRSRPQLIDFETLISRQDNSGQMVAQSQQDRRDVNSEYGIPMISYQRALGMEVVAEYSPYYSESTFNRHPQWPTHVLWAQLLTEVIVRSILELQSAPHLSAGTSSGKELVVDGADITYGLCMKGYSTFMDFDNRPCNYSQYMAPLEASGQWQFRSDVLSDPYKTGWVFEKRLHRQGQDIPGDANAITFRCQNVTYGRVKIGYTASYGSEWGVVMVHLVAHMRGVDGSISNIYYDPVQIKSKWQLLLSVRQEKEIILSQLAPMGNINYSAHRVCSRSNNSIYDGSGWTLCLEGITTRIEFVNDSGRKFKLQLIACC